jgi:TonB family protein
MRIVALLPVAVVLCVVSSALAQSDSPRVAVDRHGIEGEPIALDAKDPDVTDYLQRLRRLIQQNWAYPCVKDAVTAACEYKSANLVVEFGIFRDGPVAFIDVRLSSGSSIYDDAAVKAIKLASPFPPVPSALMDTRKAGSPGVPIVARFSYHINSQVHAGPVASTAQGAQGGATVHAGMTATSRAGVVMALADPVTVRRSALPVPVVLKRNDDVLIQDTITTGDRGRIEMLLGGKAHVTLGERSVVSITEVPGRSALELEAGQLTLDLAGERMRPGEVIAIQTPNAIVAARGTRVIVEIVHPQRAGERVVTHVDVESGSVEVAPAANATSPPIQVSASQGITITGDTAESIRGLRILSGTK